MKHEAFDVYRPTRQGGWKKVDTIFATGYTVEEMRKSLIEHDGYPPDIKVKKAS